MFSNDDFKYNTDNQYRKCKHCNQKKLLSEFSTDKKGYTNPKCKTCVADSKCKRNNLLKQADVQTLLFGGKMCGICQQIKPELSFYKSTQSKDGLSTYCDECSLKVTYYDNHDSRKAKARESQTTHRHTDEAKAYTKLYRVKNRERLNAQSRTKQQTPKVKSYQKEYLNEYRKSEHGKRVISTLVHKRMALKKNALYDLDTNDLSLRMEQQSHKCAYCGRIECDNFYLSIDHVIPISKGGSTTLDNIVFACTKRKQSTHTDLGCNQSKSNVDLLTWLKRKYDNDHAHTVFDSVQQLLKQHP